MKKGILMLMLLFSTVLFASNDEVVIKGKIVDRKDGSAIPFVTVTIEGSTSGVVSDEQGLFEMPITLKQDCELLVEHLNYHPVRIKVKNDKDSLYRNIFMDLMSMSLDEVVVTANLGEIKRQNSPGLVSTVSAAKIENIGGISLVDGLKLSSGLRVETTCQNCTFPQVRINGLDGVYSQVVVDSKPLVSSLAGVYALEQIPANMIERIEVVRGGGSTIFGGNAIAGVINVITKEPTSAAASASTTYQNTKGGASEYVFNANASTVGRKNRSALAIFGNYRKRGETDVDGDGFSELGRLQATSFGMKGYIKSGKEGKFSLEYKNINEFRRGGNMFDKQPHESDITEQTKHDINTASVGYDSYFGDRRIKLSVYSAMQHILRESYYGSGKNDKAYGHTNDLTLLNGLSLTHRIDRLFFAPSLLNYGVEYKHNKLLDEMPGYDRSIDQNVNLYSLFLQNNWDINNRVVVSLGGRFDRHSLIGDPILVARANVLYRPIEWVSLRAGYSGGYRAPEAFDEDLHVSIVGGEPMAIRLAPGLRPERSNSYNVSADFSAGHGAWRLSLLVDGFFTAIDKVFIQEPIGEENGVQIMEKRNGKGAKVYGANIDATLFYRSLLQIQLGATLQGSYYDTPYVWSEDPQVQPQRKMFRTPDRYGYLSVLYTPTPFWSFSANMVYTGPMIVQHYAGYIDRDGIEHTPNFYDLSLRAARTFRLTDGVVLQLDAGVKNVFNSFQRDFDRGIDRDSKYIYGPTLPRTLFVGLKVTI